MLCPRHCQYLLCMRLRSVKEIFILNAEFLRGGGAVGRGGGYDWGMR